jgi:hypothetical protein
MLTSFNTPVSGVLTMDQAVPLYRTTVPLYPTDHMSFGPTAEIAWSIVVVGDVTKDQSVPFQRWIFPLHPTAQPLLAESISISHADCHVPAKVQEEPFQR